MQDQMQIEVNGLPREIPVETLLAGLLEAEGEPVGHVVVEVNGRHIREHEYQDLVLRPGDRVEIILPAFGG